jgi:hypothetical protein
MKTNIDINKRWVNQGTGEIKDNVDSITTKEENVQKQEAHRRQIKGLDYYNNNILPLPTLLQEEYGNFIHTRYQALLDKINNDTATAFRFIYLCTFMEYDTGYINYKGKRVKTDFLIEIFNVSKNTMTKIKNSLYDNELIYNDKDGYIYINTEYCYRGDIIKDNRYKQQCTRIFNNSIQNLYEKSNDSREHKLLGKFVLLLPYINIWHNIVCFNTKERDISKLELPNTKQLEEILGTSSRHANRTLNELFEITVGGEKVILMVTDKKSVRMYLVNPRVYYGGNNINDLQETMGYFRVKGGI